MTLANRLRRLEKGFSDPGCTACRDRRGLDRLVTARRSPDGTLTYLGAGLPPPCEVCGEIPERVIRLMVKVISTRN